MASSTLKIRAIKHPYDFIEIVWDDAVSNSESWIAPENILDPERVVTRGWKVKETPAAVTIANSISHQTAESETVGNTMTIPRGMIVSMRKIKVSNARNS